MNFVKQNKLNEARILKEIKSRIGWVICQKHKGYQNITQAHFTAHKGMYTAIGGYGELIYLKRDADRRASDLNQSWGVDEFFVKKAELKIIN